MAIEQGVGPELGCRNNDHAPTYNAPSGSPQVGAQPERISAGATGWPMSLRSSPHEPVAAPRLEGFRY